MYVASSDDLCRQPYRRVMVDKNKERLPNGMNGSVLTLAVKLRARALAATTVQTYQDVIVYD